MKDLTTGSIPRHIVRMALPIAFGMFFQTMYVLVDLYFVSRRGQDAIAGVSAAGNLAFIVMALTQVLGVGTTTLIAQAVGRKDRDDANLVFNQSLLIGALCAAATLVLGYLLSGAYMRAMGADAATMAAGMTYLHWYLPGLALQFAMIAMGSALRGTGLAAPGMIVQIATVFLNALLAPILIAGPAVPINAILALGGFAAMDPGWQGMGVAGAGLATSLAVAAGVAMLAFYFVRHEKYVGFDPAQMHARLPVWRRILGVGLPAGGEFALMFIYLGVIFLILKHFGSAAQAGFGIGSRVMQAVFLPAMAIAWATAPIAGQNVGARLHDRVRETFSSAVMIGSVLMIALTLFCQWRPELLVGFFSADPPVVAVASDFLRIISLNFVASGILFTCSGMFQALGNTLPGLYAGATRIVTFAVPAWLMSQRADFTLRHLWFLSVATVTLQACTSLLLLRDQFRKRLAVAAAPGVS